MLDWTIKLIAALILSALGFLFGAALIFIFYSGYDFIRKRKIIKRAPADDETIFEKTKCTKLPIQKSKREVDEENESRFEQLERFEHTRRSSRGDYANEGNLGRYENENQIPESGSIQGGYNQPSDTNWKHDSENKFRLRKP